MSKKLTLQDCKNWAKTKEGECLSEEYKDAVTPLQWKCKKGHIWDNCFHHIKNKNHWCPICSGNVKLTIEEAQALAKEKGGECLSTEYISLSSKLKWKCSFGHIWKASISGIKHNKNWCPKCCTNNIKYTYEFVKEFIENKNGKLLSEDYNGKVSKLKIKCNICNYIWKATFGCLKNNNTWCPKCSGNIKLTIEHVKKFAELRGGKCISFVNLNWQCGCCNNIWAACFSDIKRGTWCPKCASNIVENTIRLIFEKLTDYKFPNTRCSWLKNPKTNYPLSLDGYCKILNLAFEYQGEQHYIFKKNLHKTEDEFVKLKERDQFKKEECKKLGVNLIIIPAIGKKTIDGFVDKSEVVNFIKRKLIDLNVNIIDKDIKYIDILNEMYKQRKKKI